MAISDSIADMFTRVRNALAVKQDSVDAPFSNMALSIVKILVSEGFVGGYEEIDLAPGKKVLRVQLKYSPTGAPLITAINRVSKPGRRRFTRKRHIPKVLAGFGVSIVSTSKGVMSGREARLNNVGGELIGEVY